MHVRFMRHAFFLGKLSDVMYAQGIRTVAVCELLMRTGGAARRLLRVQRMLFVPQRSR